jgi:hypothetical protein
MAEDIYRKEQPVSSSIILPLYMKQKNQQPSIAAVDSSVV